MASVSIATAYLLWALFGFMGFHHLYLGRPNHALLWLVSGAGFGVGWLRDFFYMHTYAKQARNASEFVPPGEGVRPTGSWSQFLAAMMFIELFRSLFRYALPEQFAEGAWCGIPAAAVGTATAIYLVGNNGRVAGKFLPTLASALIGEFLSFAFPVYCGAFVHNYLPYVVFGYTRYWVKRRGKPSGCCKALSLHFLKGFFFLVLLLSCLWFNATISVDREDGTEETLKLRDHLKNIYKSPAVQEFLSTLGQLYVHVQHNGWQTLWDEFVKKLDMEGEARSYKALGLDESATPEDVKKAYRSLARKYHPDKCGELECEDKFREIQEAYETLKNIEEKGSTMSDTNDRRSNKANKDRSRRRRRKSKRTEDEL
eukprot:CAMPEP_0114524208 /NCGR_PEP_ID=MMETSP0109-20121206/21723_1 /TAXON_ID=29199 /ORGANISM="Chlorarachnion reptans, Strain CCCM449" /LENGTH=369 /DNA_ID=CAMNT_0001705617 /DNA_START=55 /DNA_END=1164 /DNA_ORIENTATION=-